MSKKVVVVGGGWGGVSAAVSARNAGAEVVVLERSDMLLGTGLVGGIMRNNGRFTATEELIAMGGGEVFEVIDNNSRHKNIEFPGHKHANLYDISKIEPAVLAFLRGKGIEVRLQARVKDVVMEGKTIKRVVLDNNEEIPANVYIDATGSAGPMNNCNKHANGCVMCALRCPTFGGRVSLAEKAGATEYVGKKKDGSFGAMSGSCKLFKESLSSWIVEKLNKNGVVVVPIPEEQRFVTDSAALKACQQYALPEFSENIVLLDTGHAKLMMPFTHWQISARCPVYKTPATKTPTQGGGVILSATWLCRRETTPCG
jgi:pyruvate/2-oxoglutarate dehydrogenase complex dihydrolipoamide dehydrogenase (E3) component